MIRFSCLIVALILVDTVTEHKIKWLDDITDYMITIYLPAVAVFIVVLFVAAVSSSFYAIWTQM
jgi:hypothetical protein